MAYTKHTWQNGKSGGTPINATRLNEMEDGIEAAGETAADALGVANSATAVAGEAVERADEAKATASDANATAHAAKATADNAVVLANTAQATADLAGDRADAAQTSANAAKTTADTALLLAQQGGSGSSGGSGLPSKYIHLYVPKGEVPSNMDLATDWQIDMAESTAPGLLVSTGNNRVRAAETGYYDFNFTASTGSKAWTGGWMAVKSADQTQVYASQDMPSGIANWCISGGAYLEAGEEIFVQFHPAGSGNFLTCRLDFRVALVGDQIANPAPPKVANLSGVIGSNATGAINVRLNKDAATGGSDTSFVTVPGTISSEFTITETGHYGITALVQSSSRAFGSGAYLQIVDKAKPDPVIASGVPATDGWWYTLERNSVYLSTGTVVRLIFQGASGVTYNANALKFFVTIEQKAPNVSAGAGAPRGLVAWAKRTDYDATTAGNVAGGGAAKPFLRLDVNLEPGRTYEIATTPLKMGLSEGTNVRAALSYREGDIATVYSRTLLTAEELRGKGHQDGDGIGPLRAILPVAPTANPKHSFLIEGVVIGSNSSSNQAGFRPSEQWPAVITVTDVGPYVAAHSVRPGPGPDDNPAWNPAN